MLDNTGILFSSVMLLWVVLQAMKIDLRQPWFDVEKRTAVLSAARASWRGRGGARRDRAP